MPRDRQPLRSPDRLARCRGRIAGAPNPVDVHVGARLRLRRTLLGMSQEVLADALGLTFQQVQKYERGANRVGASRLFDLSRVLDVPVTFFFDAMEGAEEQSPARLMGAAPLELPAAVTVADADGEAARLLEAYDRIKSRTARAGLRDLVRHLALATEDSDREEGRGHAP